MPDFYKGHYDSDEFRRIVDKFTNGDSGLDGLFSKGLAAYDRPKVSDYLPHNRMGNLYPSIRALEGSPNTYVMDMKVPSHWTQAQIDAYVKEQTAKIQQYLESLLIKGDKIAMPETKVLSASFDDFNEALNAAVGMSSDLKHLFDQLEEQENFDLDIDDHSEFARCLNGYVSAQETAKTPNYYTAYVEPDKIIVKRRISNGFGSFKMEDVLSIVYSPAKTGYMTESLNTPESWAFKIYRSDMVNGWKIES